MKLSKFLLLAVCMLSRSTTRAESIIDKQVIDRAEIGWLIQDFPPLIEGYRIGDPDLVLSDEGREQVEQRIEKFEESQSVLVNDLPVSVQIGIGLVQKMNLFHLGIYEDRQEKGVEDFAVHLHNEWGVGYETSNGGTGIVIFMSIDDRALYVSRGGALNKLLTDSRIDRLIKKLRPSLQKSDYKAALILAIDIAQEYIESGPPNWKEHISDNMPTIIIASFISTMIGMFVYQQRKIQHQQREYAQVASQLSQLDRARAEALQGQYQATSCPICFEDFKSSTVGSDDQPIKLLRCGHVFDESCWAEWVNGGSGNVTKCPICQQDVGTGQDDNNNNRQNADNNNDNDNNHNPPQPQWQEDAGQVHEDLHQRRGQRQRRRHHHDRAMRMYQHERNFRLARLRARYPRYIAPNQIQQWTEDTYDGTLARDPDFVKRDPEFVRQQELQQRRAAARSSHHSSSFGGGGSSGGRSGRW